MWSKETKEEKERKKEQAFYEHYGAMGKAQIPLEKSGRDARGMNNAFDASRDEGELQSY